MAKFECTCASICPDYAHCICIDVPSTGQCHFYCEGHAALAKREDETEVGEKVSLDCRVKVDMRGASLGDVGKLVAKIANAHIYVPADRIDELRDLYLPEVSLEAVVQELGLMAVGRP